MYQPKTGERCGCKKGIERDNCPACEGTGWRIDFKAIHEKRLDFNLEGYPEDKICSCAQGAGRRHYHK